MRVRERRRADAGVFDTYMDAMVQLGDEDLKKIYGFFMLIYMAEETDEASTAAPAAAIPAPPQPPALPLALLPGPTLPLCCAPLSQLGAPSANFSPRPLPSPPPLRQASPLAVTASV